jgi:co-chaperonin GroES (HSP10)
MMLKPTGHRILIQPDDQPEQSGAILLPQHRDFVATSGTVIALGPRGSRVRWEARQRGITAALKTVTEDIDVPGHCIPIWRRCREAIRELLDTPDPEHEIAIGDRVAFDSESGLRLVQDGIEYLILDEDDVVVIVEELEATA